MLDRRVIRDLEGQVASSHVYTRPADLAAYAYDAWGASGERHLPEAVVFPESTAQVSALLKRGLLKSDTPYGKLRFGVPLHALRFYFPNLWPEAEG